MKPQSDTALRDLIAHAPRVTYGQVREMFAEIMAFFVGGCTAKTMIAMILPGDRLIAIVRADRAEAIAYAADAERAKQFAQRLRDYASLFDEGESRIATALSVRDDYAEILAEANGLTEPQAVAIAGDQ